MRVTQSMLAHSSLRHLNNSFSRLGDLQDQLSTGKKITRASQDPVVAMNGMRYRTQVLEVKQFKRNLSEVYNWMEATDSALDKATQVLHRVRELVQQAANDTYEENQRASIAKEVGQLIEEMATIANTKSNNKYIFNGTNTTEKPVSFDGTVSENDANVEIELLKGVYIPVNSNPTNVFTDKLFNDLRTIQSALENDETTGENLTGYLEIIDGHMNNVVNERAEVGARYNRVEMIQARLEEQEVIATRIMSDNEDADLEEVIIHLITQENVHRAALGAGARIIQPTLLDFLR